MSPNVQGESKLRSQIFVASLCFITLFWSSAWASDLGPEIQCWDESGEALSELYDAADTATQFEIVRLDPELYELLVDGFGTGPWSDLNIWQIAELERTNYPEIYRALAQWVQVNCQSFETR